MVVFKRKDADCLFQLKSQQNFQLKLQYKQCNKRFENSKLQNQLKRIFNQALSQGIDEQTFIFVYEPISQKFAIFNTQQPMLQSRCQTQSFDDEEEYLKLQLLELTSFDCQKPTQIYYPNSKKPSQPNDQAKYTILIILYHLNHLLSIQSLQTEFLAIFFGVGFKRNQLTKSVMKQNALCKSRVTASSCLPKNISLQLNYYSFIKYMKKVKSEPKLSNTAQVFSSLVEMRFRPISQLATEALGKRKEKWEKSKKELVQIYDPLSMVLHADRKIENNQSRRLKFLVSLSTEHFIVGNENQIDMIGFGAIAYSFVQTDFYWSLTLKGPIESVIVEQKRSIFIILSESTLYFYRYSTKTKQQPEMIASLVVREGVRFIRFLKDILLGVFYNSSYQFYNIENLGLIKKKLQKNYPIDANKKLLTIPSSIENIINVFFEQPKDNKQYFILWCLEINFGTEQIKTRELYRVYDIMNHVKGKLSIQNYTKEIIFMNLDHQIMAIKNGYLIDTVNVSVKGEGEFLNYIHPETILHITKKHVEVYNFSINMAVKPEKIVLRSMDSIQIQRYPENAFYISVLKANHNNFAIFFQDSDKKIRQTRGEISYYFEVSQTTTVKAKIKNIFDSVGYGQSNPQIIEEKYNMALKMGLTEKEIYLQIWSRSNRSSLEDYQYILATKDYRIIKLEIEKKLKKESMNLREILKIQESCHEINRQKIESQTCCQQDLQDFVSSHFLLKKLKLYKEIHVVDRFSGMNLPQETSEGEAKQMKIDIQQYYFFKNLDVKTYILDQINEMLINFKNNAKIIRMTIKDFKFVYRLIYPQILEEIIISAKDNLINLLNQIPEIMPYIHKDLNEEQRKEGLYGGIWGPIETYEWQKSLYPEIIESIHNKQVVKEFVSSLWFRRYWLTANGMTGKSKKEILKINEYNNSDKIFYFFIAQLYEHCKNNKPFYYQTINFLQQKYEMFPHHLKNKIVLYENLYTYYFIEEKANPSRLSLTEFLQLDDQSLFKYFFDHQKAKKNSLLKQIKPIYQQSDVNGLHIFNIGLFSYFYSDISEISDLKFILNRINNQKTEFHKKNHGIYQVLVRSMQLKLRIGSPNDIPIDEVMVYIKNIPVNREEEIMQELNVIQNIKQEVTVFQKMKINMTVKDIMDKFEVVVQKLLKYFLEQHRVFQLSDYQQLKQKSIEILKQTERIKKKIYSVENSTYSLLVYLSLIMRNQNCIEKVARLLQDSEIHHLFQVEEKTIENIVFYMFKWKFTESAKYTDNAEYLQKLLDLLPCENSCRNYLNTQLQIGLILSSNTNQFLYPLSETSHSPNIKTIHDVFKSQSQKYLLELNVERLYQLLSRMQKLVQRDSKKVVQTITLHKLYEILIVELLEKELFREVIDYLQKILQLESQIKNQGIIYVSLYIYKVAKEFNEESKKCIFKLFSLYFKEPQALLKILEFIIKTRLTGLQQTKYLRGILQTESQARFNFSNHNSILNKEFTSNCQHPNAKKVIEVYRDYLKSKNQEFEQNSQYDIIFTILCHSPYLLLKFLQLEKQHLRFKEINMFIHMVVNRPIFNEKKSYEVLKRIFTALIIHNKQSKDIDLLLINFQSKSSEEEFQVPKFNKLSEQQGKILRIVRSFCKAQKILKRKEFLPKDDLKDKKILQIKNVLENPATILHDKFDVEEQENYSLVITQEKSFAMKNKPQKISFNEVLQKKILFFRKENFGQFIQIYGTQKVSKSELELIKRQSSPILQLNSLSESVNCKKVLRNQMIERLHSHKVVNRSENNDDIQSRKDDEQFSDYFLPKKVVNESRSSVGSESVRGRGIPQEISTINKNTSKVISVSQSQNKVDVPVDEILIDLDQTSKSQELQERERFEQLRERFEQLREQLIKNYNETKIPRFDLTPLQPHIQSLHTQNQKDFPQHIQTFLRNFFNYLYSQSLQTQSLNLKLIEDVARKYHAAGVNNFFLQAYQRIFATHEKHGLEMNIAELLPLSGVYIKSKDIVDLFHEIEPLIIAKITDENVFKLSKLIALGFRKTIVEQQILFNYLKGLAKNYIKLSEEQLPPLTQKFKSILHKFQVQVLIDKGEQFFRELPEGERRDQMLLSYTGVLKNKSYQSAARDLISKLS